MKAGLSLSQLAAEIERQAESKIDYVAPSKQLAMIAPLQLGEERFEPRLNVGAEASLALNKHAHRQLGEYLGIPAGYYDRMLAQQPALLAHNANVWLGASEDKRMVRVLDDRVRAILSDRYRPLENFDLAKAIFPVLQKLDLMVLSADVTETKLYIKAVDRRIQLDVPTGRRMGDGTHVFFDTVSPAITISNSEVGNGSLSVLTSIFTKVCTNLATLGPVLRKYHIGGKQGDGDEIQALLSDRTKSLSDAAVFAQVRDVVAAAFDEARFKARTDELAAAAEDRVPVEVAPAIVTVVAKTVGLNEGEKKGVLTRLIEGGDWTRYGVHAAITRHAEDVRDYDRASELEAIGGKVIELPKADWRRWIGEAEKIAA